MAAIYEYIIFSQRNKESEVEKKIGFRLFSLHNDDEDYYYYCCCCRLFVHIYILFRAYRDPHILFFFFFSLLYQTTTTAVITKYKRN